jgi:hypothetical protein
MYILPCQFHDFFVYMGPVKYVYSSRQIPRFLHVCQACQIHIFFGANLIISACVSGQLNTYILPCQPHMILRSGPCDRGSKRRVLIGSSGLWHLVSLYDVILKMEAIYFSETLVSTCQDFMLLKLRGPSDNVLCFENESSYYNSKIV